MKSANGDNAAGSSMHNIETFEKCSILPAQLNLLKFNRGSSSRQAKILTTGIH
jgi:hypothetical protein